MYMNDGLAAAVWVAFGAVAIATAMSPVIVWYLQ
jgi:hypothetical protein